MKNSLPWLFFATINREINNIIAYTILRVLAILFLSLHVTDKIWYDQFIECNVHANLKTIKYFYCLMTYEKHLQNYDHCLMSL